jgi:hypothetical protein
MRDRFQGKIYPGAYSEQQKLLIREYLAKARQNYASVTAEMGAPTINMFADDLWHSDKLANRIARFEAWLQLDMSVTNMQNFWVTELEEEPERFRDHRVSQPLPGYVPQAAPGTTHAV